MQVSMLDEDVAREDFTHRHLDPVEAASDANAAAAGATSTPTTAVAMSCRSGKVSLYHNETQTRLLGCSKPLR